MFESCHEQEFRCYFRRDRVLFQFQPRLLQGLELSKLDLKLPFR